MEESGDQGQPGVGAALELISGYRSREATAELCWFCLAPRSALSDCLQLTSSPTSESSGGERDVHFKLNCFGQLNKRQHHRAASEICFWSWTQRVGLTYWERHPLTRA